MLLSRPPSPALRPFVRVLWTTEPATAEFEPSAAGREHVLPTGCMHLALRLRGPAVRLFRDTDDTEGIALGHAVIGGARGGHYVREVAGPACTVGVQLEPGAAAALFGAPADAFSNAHTPLGDVCGALAGDWMEQLEAAASAHARLAVLEALLCQRLRDAQAPHPAARQALALLRRGSTVEQAAREAGCSHRHLITVFRHATGLAPREYARILRLQAVLAATHHDHGLAWAEAALAAGYSDQSHFNREFRAFSGLTPSAWRRAAPAHPNHVPLPAR